MSYPVASIATHLGALEAPIGTARKNGTYAGHEQEWDKQVIQVLEKDCAIAEHNIKVNAELVEIQKANAKEIIDSVEQFLKNKKPTEDQYQFIEQAPGKIRQCVKRIADDGAALMEANGEYRGQWPNTARGLLSQGAQGLVAPYEATRKKGIDSVAALKAVEQRCREYAQRIEEYAKQATQRKSHGDVEIESFNKDVEEITNKMTAGGNEIDTLHHKRATNIKYITDREKAKTWTTQEMAMAKSMMGTIAGDAKNGRGILKTLTVLSEGLEKRGKAAGPGWKEMAAKAITDAKKPYNAAAKASKDFDADEEKCRKICKNHGVNV